MPNYDYQCTKCNRKLEISHGVKEDAEGRQEHINADGLERCNGNLKRLISKGISHRWSGGSPTPNYHG